MTTTAVLVTIAILTLASMLVALLNSVEQLNRTVLAHLPGRTRILLVFGLVTIATIGGILTFRASSVTPLVAPPTTVVAEATTTGPPRGTPPSPGTATDGAQHVSTPPSRAEAPTRRAPRTRIAPLPSGVKVRVIGEHPSPALLAYAQSLLRTTSFPHTSSNATLEFTTSPPDPSLQGLITANLTLQVTFTDDQTGAVRTHVTVTSRGGGFDTEHATLQAQERLSAVLRDALAQEVTKGTL